MLARMHEIIIKIVANAVEPPAALGKN